MYRPEWRRAAARWLQAMGMALSLALAAVVALALPQTATAQDDTATVVLSEEPNNLEPCMASQSNIGRVMLMDITETLVEKDPQTGGASPRLATGWEQLEPETWRFNLREGVTFHDGTPFTAEAVKFSIQRHHDKSLQCEVRTKFFAGVDLTVEVVDDHTVDITATEAVPILPLQMATQPIVSPNMPMGEFSNEPIGTGPYQLDSWDVGQRITVSYFDDYWGPEPEVKTGVYVWRAESAVRAAMVQQGEADLAPNIAVQDTGTDMDKAYPNSETTRMRIDPGKAPLDDMRVRAAIRYAIDRDALQGTVFPAEAEKATQLILPQINGYNPDIELWPYNPERARELLEHAAADGVPVDREIVIQGRIGIYPNSTEAMEAISAMLNEVGLNTRVQMYEVAQWVEWLNKPHPEDRPANLLQGQHDNNSGDSVFTIYTKYHTEGANSVWSDRYLDWLIEKANVSTGEERTRLYQKAWERLNDDLLADAMLFHMVGFARVNPRINYEPSLTTNSEVHLYEITFN